MSRGLDERLADVHRLIAAAGAVYERRGCIAQAIARATGLSPEGVELGFTCLERDASDLAVRALVTAAGDAPRVHVILSANVFVAPLRALAIARAASARVTVRPSPRDPTFTLALLAAAQDDAIAVVDERDVTTVEAGEVHVYGGDTTIAEVRERARAGVIVRGHGPGMGVAIVTRGSEDLGACAEALAADVVAFDQRGCLSPRLALVEGDLLRARAFALALHDRLGRWGERVPRGELSETERADATRWYDTLAFAGSVWAGPQHAVALAPAGAPLAVAPPGRHVGVAAGRTLDEIMARVAPVARFVVNVGTDDPERVIAVAPARARIARLGCMQHPELDGPVDRR